MKKEIIAPGYYSRKYSTFKLCTFFSVLVFRSFFFSFGLFPFVLTADPLKLREDFAITHVKFNIIISFENGYVSAEVHLPLIVHKQTVMPHYKNSGVRLSFTTI